jgi:glycosyltransferase involved in cell wall biosynthesis
VTRDVAGSRVAVVIPLYNLRAFVAEAIESALAQSIGSERLEVVVVDDGSVDGGGDVAAAYAPPVTVIRQENRGLSAARNVGIAATTAPFLQFLDADDRLLPEKLACQAAILDTEPDVGLVYAGWRHVDEEGRPLPQHGWSRDEGDVLLRLLLGNLLPPVVPLVRREAVERAGRFDERLTSVEDWDLWLRISRLGYRWRVVDRPLADYRVRPGGMHRNAARMLENRLRVLDGFFAAGGLPGPVVAARDAAYARAYLVAACDHYRAGDERAGAAAFRTAVARDRSLLADARRLRQICRSLLPVGSQSLAATVRDRARLLALLKRMLDQLFAAPDLDPMTASLRGRVRRAYVRTLLDLAWKGAWA